MLNYSIRKILFLFIIVASLIISDNIVNAQDKQFYIGLGGAYQLTNLADDNVFDWDDHSWGANAKFGYRLTDSLFTQIDFDYLPGIEYSDGDLMVFAGFLSLKGYVPDFKHIKFSTVKPFIIAGVGFLHYNFEPDDSNLLSIDDKETSLSYKFGGGLDIFLNDIFSIGLEGNYTVGTNDVENIEYFNFILGASYHF